MARHVGAGGGGGASGPVKSEMSRSSVPDVNRRLHVVPKLVAAGLLLLALGHHPYSFYVALRWVVCGAAGFVIWNALVAPRGRERFWAGIFVAVAVLFNPIIPITADRAFWSFWDIVCAVLFIISCAIETPTTDSTRRRLPLER
jgi:hypothetical protein